MPPALALPPQKVRHRTKAPSPSTAPAPSSSPSTATATAASSPPISNTQSSPPPMSPTAASKLPRFLQSPAQRDRSKSLSVDRPPSVASNNTSTSSSSGRRRLLGIGSGGKDKERERERQRIREAEQRGLSAQELLTLHEAGSPDSYVCGEDDGDADRRVGPSSYGGTARPRTRSERHFSASTPPSSASDYGHGNGNGNSTNTNTLQLQRSPSRLDGPLATRLSGWFAHLAGSTSDLSLANTISGAVGHSVSTAHSLSKSRESKEKDAGGSKTSLLDKAVRYLLDGDAAPDRAAADIWLLGARFPGWGPADEARVLAASVSSNHNNSFSHAHSHHHSKNAHPEAGLEAAPWPAAFHARFYALVWCTYRAGFEPIRDLPSLSALPPPLVVPSALAPPSPSAASHNHNNTKHGHGHSPTQSDSSYSSAYSNSSVSSTSSHGTRSSGGGSTASAGGTKKKWWPLGGTKGWTSDAGWGCMLRTGQSLLACALSRVGELDTLPAPHFPPPTARAHALHARLLSWFLDAPVAPFGVHRMALAGKALGKDVGMWFGPSAAAGAIRTLVDAFPAAGLGVSVATDGTLYQTEVFAASHSPAATAGLASASSPSVGGHSSGGHGKSTNAKPGKRWGDRPVLLLLGIRLGLDGVNPVYYETIKLLYTFPQSVGIAGGRPSSSYYFVGVQGDGLFYLDPHHSRPAVPMRPAPSDTFAAGSFAAGSPAPSPMSSRAGSMSPEFMHVNMHANARARSMSPDANAPMTEDELTLNTSTGLDSNTGGMGRSEEAHYARAYTTAELRTFHCERVRKMPLSGLDPSMLIGFVCRDEAEWVDLRRRVAELPRTIFSIQDEPPTWPGADDDDDEMGLESISDPEDHDAENDVEADGEGADRFFDDGDVSSASHAVSSVSHGHSNSTHSTSAHSHAPSSPTHYHSNSNSTTSSSRSHTRSEDVDTEEDPVGPITPLPGARFDLSGGPPPAHGKAAPPFADADADVDADAEGFVDAERDLEIEDDWVDPVAPSPPPPVKKSSSGSKKGKGKAKAKGSKKAAVPVPSVHYPFPVSVEDSPQQERQQGERERNVTVSTRTATAGGAGAQGQRMHTARARDGGRTQSGGVRGVLTDD